MNNLSKCQVTEKVKVIYRNGFTQLTIMTSMGMGTGNFDLNLSLISFTPNTITITIIEVTRSWILVEVIWVNTLSRVCRETKRQIVVQDIYIQTNNARTSNTDALELYIACV